MDLSRCQTRRKFLINSSRQALGWAGGIVAAGALARSGSGAEKEVQLGVGASLGGKQVFPADNPWNTDISRAPVDPNSDVLIASIGKDRPLHPDFGTVWEGVPS